MSHQKAVKDDWGYVRKDSGFKPEYMQLVRRDSGSINKGDNFHGLKKMSYVVEIHDFIMIPPTQHKQNSMVTFGRFPGIKLGKVSFLENLENYETTLFFFLFLLRSVSQRTVKWKLLFIEVFQLIIKEWYN